MKNKLTATQRKYYNSLRQCCLRNRYIKGSTAYSNGELAAIWGCSKDNVVKVLGQLKNKDLIFIDGQTSARVIILEGYWQYYQTKSLRTLSDLQIQDKLAADNLNKSLVNLEYDLNKSQVDRQYNLGKASVSIDTLQAHPKPEKRGSFKIQNSKFNIRRTPKAPLKNFSEERTSEERVNTSLAFDDGKTEQSPPLPPPAGEQPSRADGQNKATSKPMKANKPKATKKVKERASLGKPSSSAEIAEYLQELKDKGKFNGEPTELAERIYDYYDAADWHDQKGQKVRNWKQKVLAVWVSKAYNQCFDSKKDAANLPSYERLPEEEKRKLAHRSNFGRNMRRERTVAEFEAMKESLRQEKKADQCKREAEPKPKTQEQLEAERKEKERQEEEQRARSKAAREAARQRLIDRGFKLKKPIDQNKKPEGAKKCVKMAAEEVEELKQANSGMESFILPASPNIRVDGLSSMNQLLDQYLNKNMIKELEAA